MTKARSDLIYDVGLGDGADTAYYLSRGYHVLAIDANPETIEQARQRFADAIANQRLILLNVGIAEISGTSTFWISEHSVWSSFDRSIASRDGTAHKPISVSVVPFSWILQEHGIPHYLKIDIEGNDKLCIDSLREFELPKYLSVESECVGDSTALSDEEALAMLVLLRDVGYRRFKLVNQDGWNPARPDGFKRFSQGLVNGATERRPAWLAGIARRFTDPTRIANLGFQFAPGSSGPWGEDIPGEWMTFEQARATYLRERQAFFSFDRPLYSFWFDWHAAC